MTTSRPELSYAEPDHEVDDLPAGDLDDRRDREELRQRHYGLLQELRVLLPGTQVLVAFLLTVPFNSRFTELDALSRALYGVALGTGALAIVSLIAPTAFHRLGPRQSRAARLEWSIRLARAGLFFMAVSLVSSLTVVSRLVFGDAAAMAAGVTGSVVIILVWVALPLLVIPDRPGQD
jgi:hypothetical protein